MAGLGVDIGGSASKVAAFTSAGQICMVLDRRGKESTPTAVFLAADGQVYFGDDALQQGRIDPTRLVEDAKRKLGSRETVHEHFTAKDIYELLFKEWKRQAQEQLREDVSTAVVALPVSFRDEQKADVISACRAAGLDVVGVITEPAAVMLEVLANRHSTLDPKATLRFACGDLGRATYDGSVLNYHAGQATVISSHGLGTLGGRELNVVLATMVTEAAANLLGRAVSLDDISPVRRHQLERDIEDAKQALSCQASTCVPIPIAQGEKMVTLSKLEFDRRCEKVLAPAIASFRAMLDAAKLTPQSLDLVVWAGGPFLSEAVRDYFDKSLGVVGSREAHPVLSVARGAARHALQYAASSGQHAGRALPASAVTLLEATTFDYGIGVVQRGSPTRVMTCATVLPKGQPLPAVGKATFRLEHENQNRVELTILQGADGALLQECTVIGTGALDSLPPELIRSPRIECTFTVDATNMVLVEVVDLISKLSTRITLRPGEPVDRACSTAAEPTVTIFTSEPPQAAHAPKRKQSKGGGK
jgi:molecular chaperone DnaK (HSP70)